MAVVSTLSSASGMVRRGGHAERHRVEAAHHVQLGGQPGFTLAKRLLGALDGRDVDEGRDHAVDIAAAGGPIRAQTHDVRPAGRAPGLALDRRHGRQHAPRVLLEVVVERVLQVADWSIEIAWLDLEDLAELRRESLDPQIGREEEGGDVGRGHQVREIVVRPRDLIELDLQLLVDGMQLLVDALQLLLARFELLGGRAVLLVQALEFLVGRAQILGGEVSGRPARLRRAARRAATSPEENERGRSMVPARCRASPPSPRRHPGRSPACRGGHLLREAAVERAAPLCVADRRSEPGRTPRAAAPGRPSPAAAARAISSRISGLTSSVRRRANAPAPCWKNRAAVGDTCSHVPELVDDNRGRRHPFKCRQVDFRGRRRRGQSPIAACRGRVNGGLKMSGNAGRAPCSRGRMAKRRCFLSTG